ncbi:Membrane protein-like protein [Zostera marina]|uniref:Membrane protein-like protein n=1 Tax=Zostera marina TaxID=29655 RepID=A0A0K9PEP3_ZOSMR|nr:Membrane protein-like protein [Zostera marina]
MNFRNMEEFWAFYVNQHSKATTRKWHFIGALSGLVCFLCSIILLSVWLLMLVPILGYGLAWYSHFFFEGNSPSTFRYPLWSLLCDLKMFGLMLTGQMDREIKRLGKRPILQVF